MGTWIRTDTPERPVFDEWWSQAGSNRRPPACHAGALPAELWPHCWKARKCTGHVARPSRRNTEESGHEDRRYRSPAGQLRPGDRHHRKPQLPHGRLERPLPAGHADVDPGRRIDRAGDARRNRPVPAPGRRPRQGPHRPGEGSPRVRARRFRRLVRAGARRHVARRDQHRRRANAPVRDLRAGAPRRGQGPRGRRGCAGGRGIRQRRAAGVERAAVRLGPGPPRLRGVLPVIEHNRHYANSQGVRIRHPNRAKRQRFPVTACRFREARLSSGLGVSRCADLLRVSERTIRNWESGAARIPYAAYKLLRVLRGGRYLSDPIWRDFSVVREVLVTPEGHRFHAGDLAWWSLLIRRARAFSALRQQRMQSDNSEAPAKLGEARPGAVERAAQCPPLAPSQGSAVSSNAGFPARKPSDFSQVVDSSGKPRKLPSSNRGVSETERTVLRAANPAPSEAEGLVSHGPTQARQLAGGAP